MPLPLDIVCVIPSRLAVGEVFDVKLRVLGPVRQIKSLAAFDTLKPGLHGPFNLNTDRQIHYVDNCLPDWEGRIEIDANDALDGPDEIRFDGHAQGVFPGDTRPIRVCGGFAWREPGFHFPRLTDPESGLEAWSNPVYVTQAPPEQRLYWGDPHWQTFFSDGIRCPEELYAFARDEGFLDFGAITDHMEAVTDRQWDYFQSVTNDYNNPGRFVTLQGQEWTHHDPAHGAPGHRNIYYRGDGGPALRSNDEDCNTLTKLWNKLDESGLDAIAVPHHPANKVMGVDWEQGWSPAYEKAVEIYSVWGSSEKPRSEGNTRPIESLGGELAGRHVRDALARGYLLGFMGGGDVHDGRPGDPLHERSYPPGSFVSYESGLTGAWVSNLTRENIFDAIRNRRTYAATHRRIYLEAHGDLHRGGTELSLRTASEDGIQRIACVRKAGESDFTRFEPGTRTVESVLNLPTLSPDDYLYIRVETAHGDMAWSSPITSSNG